MRPADTGVVGAQKAVLGVDFDLRAAEPGEMSLVMDSWRRSYGDARHARSPSRGDYIAAQKQVIAAALASSEVTVAYCPEVPDEVLGWACYRPPSVVHYVYVKDEHRRRGIGAALWQHATRNAETGRVYITHDTVKLGRLRGARWTVFNPALIFGGETP